MISISVQWQMATHTCHAIGQVLPPEYVLWHNPAGSVPCKHSECFYSFPKHSCLKRKPKSQLTHCLVPVHHWFQLAPDSKGHVMALQFHARPSWNGLVSKWGSCHLCSPLPEQHTVLCGNHLPFDFCHPLNTRPNRLHPSLTWVESLWPYSDTTAVPS